MNSSEETTDRVEFVYGNVNYNEIKLWECRKARI